MKDILDIVGAAAAQAETGRRLPDAVVGALRDAGLLRMAVPEAFGGEVCPLPELLRRLMLLATADSSTAWLVMVWTQAHIIAARLGEDRYRTLFEESPDVILAATSAGSGTASPASRGVEVSGDWRFVSGSSHATGVFVHCELTSDEPGRQVGVLLPARSLSIDNTWSTLGLRATASNGVHADRVELEPTNIYELAGPVCRSATTHSRLPIRPSFALHMGAVAIGNARASRHGGTGTVAHEPDRSEPTERLWLALQDCAKQVWARPREDGDVDEETARRMSELGADAVQTAVDVIVSRYRERGSQVIYDCDPLQRRLRDALTMSQHANVSRGRRSGGRVTQESAARVGPSR